MLVPSTRSGRTPPSNRACSIPTSAAPRTPPPPSTNAVVMALTVRGPTWSVGPVALGPPAERVSRSHEGVVARERRQTADPAATAGAVGDAVVAADHDR